MHLRPNNRVMLTEPPDAYSRVTDAERFRPLHELALDLLGRLRSRYEVTESAAFDLLPGIMQPFEQARPPVTLFPVAPGAAPIAFGFTTFPGLVVRCGRWFSTPFPVCGCDACAATAEHEGARLEELIGDVVAGEFREQLKLPLVGDARLEWWLGSLTTGDRHHGKGGTKIRRDLARMLRVPGSNRVQWKPWPERRDAAADTHAV